jgi:hypothetical protein
LVHDVDFIDIVSENLIDFGYLDRGDKIVEEEFIDEHHFKYGEQLYDDIVL